MLVAESNNFDNDFICELKHLVSVLIIAIVDDAIGWYPGPIGFRS